MKKIITFLMAFGFVLLSSVGWGQVDIIDETLRSGSAPVGWTDTEITWATTAGGFANFTGTSSILVTPIIDLTNYTGVELTFSVAKFGTGTDGPITVEISDDGGSTWTAQTFDSPTPTSATYLTSGPTSIAATGNEVVIRLIRSNSPSQKRVRDFVLQGVLTSSGPDNPASFTAEAISSSQINLAATANAASNNIVVAYNSENTFGEPTGSYSVGNAITGGGTVHYVGAAASLTDHTGLSAGETVYYKAWSVDGSNEYSLGVGANATTIAAEPSNHPTAFSADANSASAITVSWTDADPAAAGYLIKGSAVSYAAVTAPVDGTPEADGGLVKNVAAGVQSHQFTGLDGETTYYFKIFPFNGLETTVNYKTAGAPQDDATTPEGLAFTVVNFDDAGKWTAGTAALGSYASNHTYVDGLFSATGGPAIRNGTAAQDGFPGALGTYSWRLRDNSTVDWAITIASGGVGVFEVDVRRWDDTPSPDFALDYSVNGGTDWVNVTTINNASLDNSSDWKTFTGTIDNPSNNIQIRFKANGTTERIMIDNFKWTAFGGEATTNWLADASSSDWSSPANWSNGLPGTASDVVINSGANDPLLSNGATVQSLTINASAKLTIAASGQLTVSGLLTNNAGNDGLAIKSNATGTGSLIHSTAGVAATVERYINGGGYHLVSVPITQASSPVPTLFLHSYLFRFDAATQAWVGYGDNPFAISVDEGYMIHYTGASTTYSFAGNMHQGDFVAATPAAASVINGPNYDGGYNLVPNPYPSAINWNAAGGFTETNLFPTIYIYNRNTGNYGAYVRDAGSGTNSVSNVIPVGQAFFVQANTVGAASLTIKQDARMHSANNILKDAGVPLELLKLRADANSLSDELVIQFNESASMDFESHRDAQKLRSPGSAPQLYSLTPAGTELSINTIPYNSETIIIPLGFELAADEAVSFNFAGLESFDAAVDIFLEDKLTDQMINLRENPEYSFSHSQDNNALRFRLHFMGVTGTEELAQSKDHHIWSHEDKLYIHIPDLSGEQVQLELYDLMGRQLTSISHNLGQPSIISVPYKGVVIARIVSGERVYTNKLIIR